MTLQHGSTEQIQSMFSRLQREIRSLIKSVIKLVYFMRGAIQYDEMMDRTYIERQLISEFIDERLEQESKNPHPIY